jgi:hypothetical protein
MSKPVSVPTQANAAPRSKPGTNRVGNNATIR